MMPNILLGWLPDTYMVSAIIFAVWLLLVGLRIYFLIRVRRSLKPALLNAALLPWPSSRLTAMHIWWDWLKSLPHRLESKRKPKLRENSEMSRGYGGPCGDNDFNVVKAALSGQRTRPAVDKAAAAAPVQTVATGTKKGHIDDGLGDAVQPSPDATEPGEP